MFSCSWPESIFIDPDKSTPVLSFVYARSYDACMSTGTASDDVRMGRRIKQRLDELGWRQVDLLALIPELEKGTLSAMIAGNRIASEHSDQIAEALGVEHRWLQKGTGVKLRTERWPFSRFAAAELAQLPPEELARIEGYIEARLEEHRKAGAKSAA